MKLPPRVTPLDLNLAPMVDVMMCLLIFFMLAAQLVERENSVIDLPPAKAAREAEKQDLGSRVVVNVRDRGPQAEPRAVYIVREDALTLDDLLEVLRREARRNPAVNCVIRADRTLPYRAVEAVMNGCLKSQIHQVTFSALRDG